MILFGAILPNKLVNLSPIHLDVISEKSAMSHKVEVKILSAENLSMDGKPLKKNAYVVLQLDSKYSASTKAHNEGGSNPTWNHPLTINMSLDTSVITLQVKCKTGSRDKLIGTIGIPVSDFIGDYTPENCLHFLSYRLRDSRGERNGIINVSVKVDAPRRSCATVARNNVSICDNNLGYSSLAWRRNAVGFPVSVVTGVPVSRFRAY